MILMSQWATLMLFSRQSAFTHSTLMTSLDLIACDLHSNTITYTYEMDGGSVRSWIYHVMSLTVILHTMNSGINLWITCLFHSH